MSPILNKLRDVDPNNSEAIKEALSPFFQQLPKHFESDCSPWLFALENAINRYPKFCMSQRGNIETYLSKFFDCSNYYIVIQAAKCAHALQQVRPTQEKTATAKTCWRDLMNALCNAGHTLIGAIYSNSVDIYQQLGKIQKQQESPNSPLATALSQLGSTIAKATSSNINKQSLLCTRLRNVFVFIQAMLIEIYPVGKPVRPQTILDVIVRALSVSSGNNAIQNLSDVVDVKTQALRSLDALVACLGPNLIPFSPLVFKIVMQTLKWSSDNRSEQSSRVRCSAYSSLERWLSTLHTHRPAQDSSKSWEDELTDHIIEDITPHKHVVKLQMGNQPTKHLSKKARKKLANSMLRESNMASHMPGEKNKVNIPEDVNEEVVIAALECAETFLIVCGIFLKPNTHKRFQERLVRECYAIENYSRTRALRLLRSLEAARKSVPSTVPPPTQYCLQLYSLLINSENREISNFCSQALLDIRLHLHCSPPSLNFAMEVPQDSHDKAEKKKQVSEKNRAALEALLGADKVPKRHVEEEVITIADEPAEKKPKLDECDKISVSSDSASIEISDESDNEQHVVVIESIAQEDVNSELEDNMEPIVEEAESVVSNDTIEKEFSVEKEAAIKTIDITIEDDIYDQETQLAKETNTNISEDKVDSTQPDDDKDTIYNAVTQMPSNASIFEAPTQLPLNVPDDDDETPLSMEVTYDYPNTGKESVPVLEKLDGDNLPSTNETDDIQITCGQVVKNSQEDSDAKKSVDIKSSEVKVNGVNGSLEKPLQNGDVTESDAKKDKGKDLNVEDMLADFVDEVIEEHTQTQTQETA